MDLLKTFGPLIGSVAPSIATALGGPLAGMATNPNYAIYIILKDYLLYKPIKITINNSFHNSAI